jgi:hypothetical protein
MQVPPPTELLFQGKKCFTTLCLTNTLTVKEFRLDPEVSRLMSVPLSILLVRWIAWLHNKQDAPGAAKSVFPNLLRLSHPASRISAILSRYFGVMIAPFRRAVSNLTELHLDTLTAYAQTQSPDVVVNRCH